MPTQKVRLCICRTQVEIDRAKTQATIDGFPDIFPATEKPPAPINVGAYVEIHTKGTIDQLTVIDYADSASAGPLNILICRKLSS